MFSTILLLLSLIKVVNKFFIFYNEFTWFYNKFNKYVCNLILFKFFFSIFTIIIVILKIASVHTEKDRLHPHGVPDVSELK